MRTEVVAEIKVPAIEKADKIFEFLYEREKANQITISKELNIPKATTHRLLLFLTKLNYLNYENHLYSLGEKFFIFSNKRDKYSLIKNIACPYLEELSLKFNETIKLSILDDNVIRCIAKGMCGDFVKVVVNENSVYPLHAGAASKILICQLSESKLNKLLPPILPKYTENTIATREELKKELFKVNINKVAYDNREHSKEIKAVAVPVFDNKNRIIAAISCPFFSEEIMLEETNILISEMRKASNEISKRLNYFKY